VTIDVPVLDARTFEALMAELRRRIVRYAPEWTDLNPSDPGVTLVELFAWLTETMLFQLNQVPDLTYLKFLELIGLSQAPAARPPAPGSRR
jgi:predicted phage baseplate assembly protein